MKRLIAIAASLVSASAFAADETYTEYGADMARLASLAGDWRGALSYADYGAGKREEIGMAAVVDVTPDGAFLMTKARYTDPGFDVFILTVATLDADDGAYRESYHRDGRIENYVYARRSSRDTADGWELVFEDEGVDAERPAMIRRTFALSGGAYVQRKEVDFLDDDETLFLMRNETVLTRSDSPVSFSDFRRKDD